MPTPFSAPELAEEDRRAEKAAVHYLSQTDADPAVCDLDRDGPTLPRAEASVRAAILRGAKALRIDPATASGCLSNLMASLEGEEADALLGELVVLATGLLEESDTHPLTEPLVGALLRRPIERRLPVSVANMALHRLSEIAHPLAIELKADIEVEAGLFHGRVIDATTLERLDEADLLRLSRRLRDPKLREQARSKLVVLRIRRSPWSAVRENEAEVLTTVLNRGFYAIPPEHTVMSAQWIEDDETTRVVRVQSDPRTATGKLVSATTDRELTAEPTLSLAPIRIDVAEYPEQRLEVCSPTHELDPTPCIGTERLFLDDRFAVLDGDAIRLGTALSLEDVVLLARGGDRFEPPLRIGGVAIRDFGFRLHFDPVPPMAFGSGMDLVVDFYEISHDRLLVGVKPVHSENTWSAVVPRTDTAFFISSTGSTGSQGSAGSTGSSGHTGMNGSMGSCYSSGGSGGHGGAGGSGGNGGPGGAGGRGGDILVTLHCDDCEPLRAIALRQIASRGGQGGRGGAGGSGGQGGAGGSGGSGGSCTETDSQGRTTTRTGMSGSQGPSGANGSSGSQGANGASGSPGEVVIRATD